jgi:hypothetical protein
MSAFADGLGLGIHEFLCIVPVLLRKLVDGKAALCHDGEKPAAA